MANLQTTQPEAIDIFRRLEAAGRSQRELADALNIEPNKVTKVRIGERLFKAGEVLAANRWFDQIETGPETDRLPTRAADAGETVEIIQLDLSLPMGPGATVDDYIEEQPLSFDLAYVRSFTRTPTDRLRIARGVGDSMLPTLNSSDLVWIDSTQNRLNQADRIWAASINGGAAIKRLRPLKGGRVLVISDNPAIDNYEVDAEDIVLGGRVIRFARDV